MLEPRVAPPRARPTPNILPTNDLNRPTDIAFMCLGAFGTPGTDADAADGDRAVHRVRPADEGLPPPAVDDTRADISPTVSKRNRTFAFVPNSASGDLSVVDADTWKLVDLDKSTGGYGRAPLGTLPEQISASTDGCRLVTANRGSCDLTLVDPSTLLASTFAAQYNSATVDISSRPGTACSASRRRSTTAPPLNLRAVRGGLPAAEHSRA